MRDLSHDYSTGPLPWQKTLCLTESDVVEILLVSPDEVNSLADRGILQRVKIGRDIRYTTDSVQERLSDPDGVKETWGKPPQKRNYQRKETPGPNMGKWSRMVKERDQYTCQQCGNQEPLVLQAHHIMPRVSHPQWAMELWNGVTLCANCHRLVHGRAIVLPIPPEADSLEQAAADLAQALMEA